MHKQKADFIIILGLKNVVNGSIREHGGGVEILIAKHLNLLKIGILSIRK